MNVATALTPEQWQIAGETVISAVLLSPFMAGVKKWFNVHRELLMTIYVIGGAIVTAAIAYVRDTPGTAPWLIIPLQGLVTFALSQPVYYGLVKPIRNKVRVAVAEAKALNDAKRAAALSDDGSLYQPTPATTTDFK